jgi:hypothetical protein
VRKATIVLFVWLCVGFQTSTQVAGFLEQLYPPGGAQAQGAKVVILPEEHGKAVFYEVFYFIDPSNPNPNENPKDGEDCH